MTQELSAEWVEQSVLPRFAKLVEGRSDIREAAGWIVDPNEYRTAVDHVLAAFVAEFREPIKRFYTRGGAPLRLLGDRTALARIDQRLSAAIPVTCDAWLVFKAAAERSGMSTKQAASAFISTLTPLSTFPAGRELAEADLVELSRTSG